MSVVSQYGGVIKIPLFNLPWDLPSSTWGQGSALGLNRHSYVPQFAATRDATSGDDPPDTLFSILPTFAGPSIIEKNPAGGGAGAGDIGTFIGGFYTRASGRMQFTYQSRLPGSFLYNWQRSSQNNDDQNSYIDGFWGHGWGGAGYAMALARPQGEPVDGEIAVLLAANAGGEMVFEIGSRGYEFAGPLSLGLLAAPATPSVNFTALFSGSTPVTYPDHKTGLNRMFWPAAQPSGPKRMPFLSIFPTLYSEGGPFSTPQSRAGEWYYVTLDDDDLNTAWTGVNGFDLGESVRMQPFYKGFINYFPGYVHPALPDQQSTILIFSPNMTEYWIVQLVPQTPEALGAYNTASIGWNFGIDINDIVYWTPGHNGTYLDSIFTNYTASFGLPQPLALPPSTFTLPCFDPCTSDWSAT